MSFNDFGKDIRKNVKIEVICSDCFQNDNIIYYVVYDQIDTEDVEEFGRATAGLKFESFDGGRDSRERMTQVSISIPSMLRGGGD